MFPVKCRNLQSCDLHALKSPFVTFNRKSFRQSRKLFPCDAKGMYSWEEPFAKHLKFSKPHHKVRKNPYCIPKDIPNTYDTYLRMYINHMQIPSMQQEREAGSDVNSHRAAHQLGWFGPQLCRRPCPPQHTYKRNHSAFKVFSPPVLA